ncbi:MAG: hypothetical protein FWF66_03815 [Candidatus Bathyarchaeota archaeon]|nr:hypothetical protein [Candidatus Termiticorpusculum sp.]
MCQIVIETAENTIGLVGSSIAIMIGILFWSLIILGIIGIIVFWILKAQVMALYTAECANIRARYQIEKEMLCDNSKHTKNGMRGIYETEVAGNANAF